MDRDSRTDAELLAAREPEAFASFYRRHVDAVLGFHVRRVRSAELAADLTAETFAAALEGCERFDSTRGEPVQWLFGIARHLQARALRRGRADDGARRRMGMERIALEDAELARIEASVDAPEMQAALAHLPAAQREAVLAHIVDGTGYDSLAQQSGVSQAAARQRVARGLAALRGHLGGER